MYIQTPGKSQLKIKKELQKTTTTTKKVTERTVFSQPVLHT